jgi:cytochrome c553
MKRFGIQLASLAIFLVSASPLLADDDLPIRNCTFCHGVSGQGEMVAPRIAGQRPQYIENQLHNFIGHIRDNPYAKKYMWNAAANLTPDLIHGFAGYFSSQAPRPAEDGNRDLVAVGRDIFEQGVPSENVVACIVCHGPEAQGIRQIPRLGGLSYLYVKRQLEQWNEGYRQAAQPMPKVARSLSPDKIEALASYLSFVDAQTSKP